jgi:uncharacterized protein (TIGR02145 family)
MVTDPAVWANLTTGAYCYYNNDSATYSATYGKLYNWFAINDTRGLAPDGWHVPCDTEWITLENCLGCAYLAGGKMKETSLSHWSSPNTGADNSSGFSGLPGGYRYSTGPFDNIGNVGNWWSSTDTGTSKTLYSYLDYNFPYIYLFNDNKHFGSSVRCVRD